MQAVRMRVIAFKEGSGWVAQGVELDIAAHADTLEQLPHAFIRAAAHNFFVADYLNKDPFKAIPSAPDRFRKMFDDASTSPLSVGGDDVDAPFPMERMQMKVVEFSR